MCHCEADINLPSLYSGNTTVCGLLLDGFFLGKTKLDASAAASVEKAVLQGPWGSSLSAQVLTCIRQEGQPLLCTATGLGLIRYP